jgi:dihydroorotase
MRTAKLVNPHTHLREGLEKHDLVVLALKGGVSALGPMPNTEKGLMTARQVADYIDEAERSLPVGSTVRFIPIIQITERTEKKDIDACIEQGILDAKIYPKGRTTQSHNGVAHYARIIEIVHYAGKRGMRIHFHPEHPSAQYDNRDAEFAFLPIADLFLNETEAVIVWEHGTDSRCIPHWEEWAKSGRFYVTLTAHHLVENESGAYGNVQAVCKPSYKREDDRRNLVELVGKDYLWVMAGGDDAPHPMEKKHVVGPCACGAYTAPFLLPLYAHGLDAVLQRDGGLKVFQNFTTFNAMRLYGDRLVIETVELSRKPFKIPLAYQAGGWKIEPFWAGREILYSFDS